jgi:hypothetical protein
MTTGLLSRRLALLASLAGVLLAAACGGMDDPKDKKATADQANLRAINLSTDVASVDVFTGDTKRVSSLARDAVSADAALDAGSTTWRSKAPVRPRHCFPNRSRQPREAPT